MLVLVTSLKILVISMFGMALNGMTLVRSKVRRVIKESPVIPVLVALSGLLALVRREL
jgi:hypothetical protein